MLPKLERAGEELAIAMAKELKKMLARSVAIDRAVVEGQTPHSLDEGVFYISGLRSGALAHLLRTGQLALEDVRWDDIAADLEGIKRLWPVGETDMPAPIEPEPSPPSPQIKSEAPPASANAEGIETARAQPGERRRPARDPVLLVLRELWPPNGVPPDHVSNRAIIQAVGKALKAKSQRVPDRKTILRAAGRDRS
jgi:hypothetical protein